MRSVLGLLFAALLLYGAFGMNPGNDKADRLESLQSSGERVAGKVSEVREVERTRRTGGRRSRRSETYTAHCPEITFRLAEQQHTFVEYDDCERLEVGDHVSVLVDPDRPYEARLDSAEVADTANSSSRVTWILAGAGVVFAVGSLVGIAVRISAFRARRRGASAT